MADDEEFEEGEIWAAVKDHSPHASRSHKPRDVPACYATSTKKPHSSPSMMIHRGRNVSGSRQSAPVGIPDWSKIYGKGGGGDDNGDNDDDGEDDTNSKLPPHEWLARKMARSRISASSVCEGAGRTLKGRDLSRVRDAVLTRTGFLE